MSKRRDDQEPAERRSPNQTVADASDAFVDGLHVPELPTRVPDRLREAIDRRVDALLYQLEQAERRHWVSPLEIRLVRDAHRAVLTAYELRLPGAEIRYARFRKCVGALGYERTDVGYRKADSE